MGVRPLDLKSKVSDLIRLYEDDSPEQEPDEGVAMPALQNQISIFATPISLQAGACS